jgi:hypothetical protein
MVWMIASTAIRCHRYGDRHHINKKIRSASSDSICRRIALRENAVRRMRTVLAER